MVYMHYSAVQRIKVTVDFQVAYEGHTRLRMSVLCVYVSRGCSRGYIGRQSESTLHKEGWATVDEGQPRRRGGRYAGGKTSSGFTDAEWQGEDRHDNGKKKQGEGGHDNERKH